MAARAADPRRPAARARSRSTTGWRSSPRRSATTARCSTRPPQRRRRRRGGRARRRPPPARDAAGAREAASRACRCWSPAGVQRSAMLFATYGFEGAEPDVRASGAVCVPFLSRGRGADGAAVLPGRGPRAGRDRSRAGPLGRSATFWPRVTDGRRTWLAGAARRGDRPGRMRAVVPEPAAPYCPPCRWPAGRASSRTPAAATAAPTRTARCSWWSSATAYRSSAALMTARPAPEVAGLDADQRRHRRRAGRGFARPQAAADLRHRRRRPAGRSTWAGSGARRRSPWRCRRVMFDRDSALSLMLETGSS